MTCVSYLVKFISYKVRIIGLFYKQKKRKENYQKQKQTGKNYGDEETERELDDNQDRQDRDTEIFRQKQT